MRIAVAYDCLFPWSKGGGERQYRRFAEEFAAAGHEVTYLTRRQWDGAPPELDGIKVVEISHDDGLYDDNGARTLGPAIKYAKGLFFHFLRNRKSYDAVLVSALPSTNVPAVRAALVFSGVAVGVDFLEVWRPDQWRTYAGPVIGRVASTL
ncbi:MAG: glycosyltransferase family 1 protein, partial [Saccharothrix sp.]|nr:glycosyltransferase family 1 protein [Saccharothrix sp.]